MKKKLTLVVTCVVLVAAMVIGGTLAYFTDTDKATNTFTVGNVKIELLESSLHRSNAGVENGKTSTSELWSDATKEGVTTEKQIPYFTEPTYFTDEQIKANAKTYTCDEVKLNPGESYHKMPYVVNTGKNDAYIRIRVMFPADLDTAILNSSMYTTTATTSGEFTFSYDNSGNVTRKVNEKEVKFNVYTFTRVAPLEPNQMTTWNVWGTVHMDTDVTNEEIESLFGESKAYADGTFPVLVEADAIQANTFANATEAFAAFDGK